MKTTVVPAQITTVEDKIAGSLNFAQILLLIFSLIIGTAVYGLIPPKLHISSLKTILIILQFAVLGTLAIRYRGRILADWLVIILRFKVRPRLYIYTKNDILSRQFPAMTAEAREEQSVHKAVARKITHKKQGQYKLPEGAGRIIAVGLSKKGGLDVEYQKI